MPTSSVSSALSARAPRDGTPPTAAQAVLREARRLHRAATSDALSNALPVLRRLLAARAIPAGSLPQLFHQRATVQRKHVLRMLAFEAGHESWEAYSRVLPGLDPETVALSLALPHGAGAGAGAGTGTGTLKLWFAGEAQARRYAATHGGRALRVGRQAVVLPAHEPTEGDAGRAPV